MIECPNCKSLNDDENQFCGKCGAKLPDPKYCIQGHYYSYTDDFCIKCGNKLISKEKFDRINNKIRNLRNNAKDLEDNGEFEGVLKCWDEISDFNIQFLQGIALMEKKRIYLKLGKLEEAIECCDKLIELDSNNNFAYLFKGNYLSKLKKFDEAIECYDKSISIDSNYHSPYIDKGMSLLELNRFNEAFKCFDKAFKIKNDNALYFDLVVNNLIRFLKFDEALDYCDRGLNYHPNDINLNFNKAILSCLTGDDDNATDIIVKFNLNAAMIFNSVAHNYNLIGEYNKALSYCDWSINLDSEFYHSWLTKGEIYFNLKKYDESLKYFKKGFELSPGNKEEIVNGLIEDCQEFVKNNCL